MAELGSKVWPHMVTHDKSKCKKFHVGDKVESQPDGIAPPPADLIEKLKPTVKHVYTPGPRAAKPKGRNNKKRRTMKAAQ